MCQPFKQSSILKRFTCNHIQCVTMDEMELCDHQPVALSLSFLCPPLPLSLDNMNVLFLLHLLSLQLTQTPCFHWNTLSCEILNHIRTVNTCVNTPYPVDLQHFNHIISVFENRLCIHRILSSYLFNLYKIQDLGARKRNLFLRHCFLAALLGSC